MKKLLSMLLAAMLLLAACGSSPIDENQPPAVTPAVDIPCLTTREATRRYSP